MFSILTLVQQENTFLYTKKSETAEDAVFLMKHRLQTVIK